MPYQADKRFTPVSTDFANQMLHEVTCFMNLAAYL